MAQKGKIKKPRTTIADNETKLEYVNGFWNRNGRRLSPKKGLESYIFKQDGKLYTLSRDGKIFPYTPIINNLARKFGDAELHAAENTPFIIPDDRRMAYVQAPGSDIHGAVLATNVLDTLAKHNHRLGNPLTMEELVGLPAHESTFGKYGGYIPDFANKENVEANTYDPFDEVSLAGYINTDSWSSGNYSKAASALGAAWRKFNKYDRDITDPVKTINAEGQQRIDLENYLKNQLTKDQYNSIMNEQFPTDFYKWAFDLYRSGGFNPNQKEKHSNLVKRKGRIFLNSPQGKYWRQTTGDAYNTGKRKDAGQIHNVYLGIGE